MCVDKVLMSEGVRSQREREQGELCKQKEELERSHRALLEGWQRSPFCGIELSTPFPPPGADRLHTCLPGPAFARPLIVTSGHFSPSSRPLSLWSGQFSPPDSSQVLFVDLSFFCLFVELLAWLVRSALGLVALETA